MKWILEYSPPFNTFLIGILNTGRIMINENNSMAGAHRERPGSG